MQNHAGVEMELPYACKIQFDSIVKGVWPDHELDIIFARDDGEVSALVPAWAVDKENLTVKSLIVGRDNDMLVAKLPPTQLGSEVVMVMMDSILKS